MKITLVLIVMLYILSPAQARKKIKTMYEYTLEKDLKTGTQKYSLENAYRYDVSGFLYQKTNYTKIDFYDAEHAAITNDELNSAIVYRRRCDSIDYEFIGCVENFRTVAKNTLCATGHIINFQNSHFPLRRFYTRLSDNIYRMETETSLPVLGNESGYCDSLFNLIAPWQVSVLKDADARLSMLIESDDEGNEITRKHFSYDADGRMVSDSTFDKAGNRLIKSTDYTYNNNGQCKEITYYDHIQKTMLQYHYRYNAEGYLDSIIGADDGTLFGTTYDYDYY